MPHGSRTAQFESVDDVPPPRQGPTDDGRDDKRIAYVQEQFEAQDWALQDRDKQIEENVRMLAGQQWNVWSDLLQKWVSIDRYMDDKEKRWRQRPVINRLLFWFMLTKARMTENPPVITFQPSSGDTLDAQLAEVMDPIFKTLWSEVGMLQKLDHFFSWLIASGTSYLKSRVDLEQGDLRKWLGPTTVTFEPEDGGDPIDVFVPIAPFDENGEPQVEVFPEGEGFGFEFTGEPHEQHEGMLAVDVLSPLQVRGSWGPTPWRDKRWHCQKSYFTPEEVWDKYGVDVEPDTFEDDAHGAGELQRLLYGAGYWGAADNDPSATGGRGEVGGLVTVYEFWHKPTDAIPRMRRTHDSPGGRLLICTPNQVLRDGPRPVDLPDTSPIRELRFVNLPGRPAGTTPQEMLNPIQRTYNRGVAQILEHRNLVSNPITVLDSESGLETEQITNKPGLVIKVRKRPGVDPIEYAQPPTLSEDVFRTQGMLQDEMSFLGNLQGAQGEPPTRDASGELVKELRFNTDRFIGPVMRRAVQMMGRMVEDWIAFLPTVWDQEKVIAYAGEDQITKTMTVWPELFAKGRVNIEPEIESMLPEGRGERQGRIYRMWQDGAFGDPLAPEARRKFLKLMRFPHMDRATEPGGTHRRTAKRENGKMLRGTPAEELDVLRWYDHQVHIEEHYEFMSTPEFLRQDEHIQFAFEQHVKLHELALQQQFQQMLGMQQAMAQAEGAGSEGGSSGSTGGETGPGGGDIAGAPSVVPRGPSRGGGLAPEPAGASGHRPESVSQNPSPIR